MYRYRYVRTFGAGAPTGTCLYNIPVRTVPYNSTYNYRSLRKRSTQHHHPWRALLTPKTSS